MLNKITIKMPICQAENGFSLDNLVKKLAEAFTNKAFAEILKMIFGKKIKFPVKAKQLQQIISCGSCFYGFSVQNTLHPVETPVHIVHPAVTIVIMHPGIYITPQLTQFPGYPAQYPGTNQLHPTFVHTFSSP